jgi:hypothetical protein
VKLNRKHKTFASAAVLVLLCAGCGGVSASRSVSPINFLVPGGLLQVDPKKPSFETVPPPQAARQLAQVR